MKLCNSRHEREAIFSFVDTRKRLRYKCVTQEVNIALQMRHTRRQDCVKIASSKKSRLCSNASRKQNDQNASRKKKRLRYKCVTQEGKICVQMRHATNPFTHPIHL